MQGELAEALEYQSFTADTQDREDHTFSGIFFDVSASEQLPLKYIEIHSLWVRGELGPLTVWSTPGGHLKGRVCDEDEWTKVYEKTHTASFTDFVQLKLEEPIKLDQGEKVGFYVHSKLGGDQAIVYDNTMHGSQGKKDDGKLVIWPGTAHLSNKPFGRRAPWGGDALRPRRQFVGRVGYAVRWLLWNPEPEIHAKFPMGFRRAVEATLLCAKREECYLSYCGDEIIFYIMNKCGWDWFGTAMREGPTEEETKKAEEEEAARQGGCLRCVYRGAARGVSRALDLLRMGKGHP
jgi:hypothetical protein